MKNCQCDYCEGYYLQLSYPFFRIIIFLEYPKVDLSKFGNKKGKYLKRSYAVFDRTVVKKFDDMVIHIEWNHDGSPVNIERPYSETECFLSKVSSDPINE